MSSLQKGITEMVQVSATRTKIKWRISPLEMIVCNHFFSLSSFIFHSSNSFILSVCTQYLYIFVWLISPSIMSSRYSYIVACIRISFFFKDYVYHILFIHSSTDGHFGCFHLLAVVKKASLNTDYR